MEETDEKIEIDNSNACDVDAQDSTKEKKKEKNIPKKIKGRLSNKIKDIKDRIYIAVSERGEEIQHVKRKRILVGVFAIIFLILFIAFYFTIGLKIVKFAKDEDSFEEWMNSFNKWRLVVFLLIRMLQTLIKFIPGSAMEVVAGAMYGTWWGLLWCSVGTFLGSCLILFIGKHYGSKIVGLFVSPEKISSVAGMGSKFNRNFVVFLMYFLPFLPKDIFTWVASLADGGKIKFLLITTLIRIPSVIVSTWCGNEIMQGENKIVPIIVFVVFTLVGILGGFIYKKISQKSKSKEAEDIKENISEVK